jgi:hypothetical protein
MRRNGTAFLLGIRPNRLAMQDTLHGDVTVFFRRRWTRLNMQAYHFVDFKA